MSGKIPCRRDFGWNGFRAVNSPATKAYFDSRTIFRHSKKRIFFKEELLAFSKGAGRELNNNFYFKIVVNPNGVIYDETTNPKIIERDTLPLLWQSGVKKFIKKTDHS